MDANAKIVYVLLPVIAIAVVGWMFAILGFPYQQEEQVQEIDQHRLAEKEEASRPHAIYSYYNSEGRIPCIAPAGGNGTAVYQVFMINPTEYEVVADFTITGKNADISWDDHSAFDQSPTKRLTILAGTEGYDVPFYIRPHANANNVSISTEAKVIEPENIDLLSSEAKRLSYVKDDSGSYCR